MGLPWKLTSLTWREKTNTFQHAHSSVDANHKCPVEMSPWAAAPLTPLASSGYSS